MSAQYDGSARHKAEQIALNEASADSLLFALTTVLVGAHARTLSCAIVGGAKTLLQ